MAFMVMPILSVKAQDCPEGVTGADCDLLTAAGKAQYTSFTIDSYTVGINVKGAPTGDVVVDVKGSGAIDGSKLMPGGTMLTDTTEILKALLMVLTIDAKVDASGKSQAGTIEVRFVDGVAYFKASMQGDTWFKADVEKLLAAGGGMGMNPADMVDMGSNAALTEALNALTKLSGVATTTVTDGPEIGGVKTRQFTTEINVAALVNGLLGPDFRAQLKTLAGQFGAPIDDAALAQLSGVVTMFEPLLKATKISAVQYIGVDDKLVYGADLMFATTVDAMTGAMFGLTNALSVDINFSIRLSGVNKPVTVEPVADATDLPLPGSN